MSVIIPTIDYSYWLWNSANSGMCGFLIRIVLVNNNYAFALYKIIFTTWLWRVVFYIVGHFARKREIGTSEDGGPHSSIQWGLTRMSSFSCHYKNWFLHVTWSTIVVWIMLVIWDGNKYDNYQDPPRTTFLLLSSYPPTIWIR